MNRSYQEKITLKFNVNQLDRTIVVLLANGFNKKFANNVSRLFEMFAPISYANDYTKEIRVYLVKKIAKIILERNITDKADILSFLDIDGRYEDDCKALLEQISSEEPTEAETEALDKLVSNQLKYAAIENNSDEIVDLINNLKTENYDSLETHVKVIGEAVEKMNKNIKEARESIEDGKKDLSLSSSSFIGFLDKVIEEEKNPSNKVKTGIQYLNNMLGGGFQKGQIFNGGPVLNKVNCGKLFRA